MSEHRLKTWPQYMAALIDGAKTFECRKNDRAFAVGDSLILAEWDPNTREYTGREVRRDVTYVLTDAFDGVAEGFAVLGLERGLAERDERVRGLEAALGKIVYEAERDDEDDIVCEGEVIAHLATLARIALDASAPAGEQEKTSEGDVGRDDHSSAPNSTSPPAEAPQESGVPSGKAGCRACDPLNPGDVGEPHTCSPHSPGTLRGEYERMARDAWREWYQDGADIEIDMSDEEDRAWLAEWFARVADERQREIEQRLRKTSAAPRDQRLDVDCRRHRARGVET